MAADPRAQRPARTLYKTLRLANREQGVGFKVCLPAAAFARWSGFRVL
jgi:hypothetical protein